VLKSVPQQQVSRGAAIAWVAASVFYFYQYVMRSAPGVMGPQMAQGLGLTAAELGGLLALFYYGYAPFSLVAGVLMDRLGPRRVAPAAAALAGVGCLMYATGNAGVASAGALLQGAGAVFALITAVYIATTYLPPARVATLIGATQMFGMAGGSAGQFLAGPAIAGGVPWNLIWLGLGLAGLPLAALLLVTIPAAPKDRAPPSWAQTLHAIVAVAKNPQSILCGLIAGLMFMPTTIFGMVWGVRYLQEAHEMPYMVAVLRSAAVPAGWIIGSPLLGALSDRIGLRRPVIAGAALMLLACLALILYAPAGTLPPFSLGLLAGVASGGAMLPYTVIKEANPAEYRGTATGVIGFINFSLSAVLGPVFGGLLLDASGGSERELVHYQAAFLPLLFAVALACVLALVLRETGAARANVAPQSASALRS